MKTFLAIGLCWLVVGLTACGESDNQGASHSEQVDNNGSANENDTGASPSEDVNSNPDQNPDVIPPAVVIDLPPVPDPVPQPEPVPEPTDEPVPTAVPSWITASSDDGNEPEQVYDNVISEKSRWSAQGNEEWLQFDFGEEKNFAGLSIAFYKGDERIQYFNVMLSTDGESWEKAYEGMSCGESTDLEKFEFEQASSGRYLRIVGQGTSVNEWNSITEIKFGADKGELAMHNAGIYGKNIPSFITVAASSEHVLAAANTLDNSLVEKSHWVGSGEEQWLIYDLSKKETLYGWNIAFLESAKQAQPFALDIKASSGEWQEVYNGESRIEDPEFQSFTFARQETRYVRLRATSSHRLAILEAAPIKQPYSLPTGVTYHVSPTGNDDNNGVTRQEAFQTIQHALDLAQPGDRVLLAAGEYYQDAQTVRSGTKTMPITIEGPSNAIVRGESGGRVFQSSHSYIHFLGFTINGKTNDGSEVEHYREKLLYIIGDEPHKGPKGIIVRGMNFLNAGGECLRLRYYINGADVSYNYFENCGVRGFKFNTGGKNGEAIYLGTASGQWNDGKNPTGDADVSSNNIIHHNMFDTKGNECIDIKEGSINNTLEYNYCTGQKDPNSGGFDSRGNFNIIRYNVVENNLGAGIRLGGHTVNGQAHGEYNDVYGNVLLNNGGGPFKFVSTLHRQVCENETDESQEPESYDGYYKGISVAGVCAVAK